MNMTIEQHLQEFILIRNGLKKDHHEIDKQEDPIKLPGPLVFVEF